MQRISKKLALIIVVCGLMVVTFATPVAGQIDPGENVNLIEREPEEAARMRAALDVYLEREPLPGVLSKEVRIDPGIAAKLRALGYMQ